MSVTRAFVAREAGRRMRQLLNRAGHDMHQMRVVAGLTLTDLGRVAGVDPTYLARIEAGQVRPSLDVLMRLNVALGADLSLRSFDGAGPRLHDRIQALMTESFLRHLAPRWRPTLEVAVTQPNRGVVDVVLEDEPPSVVVATELQSDLWRLEQQVRWASEKADGVAARLVARGSPVRVSRLLVLRSTVRTRELARRYETVLATAYPAQARMVIEALTAGAPWPGAGLVWMRVEGGVAELLNRPPRGVTLGRR